METPAIIRRGALEFRRKPHDNTEVLASGKHLMAFHNLLVKDIVHGLQSLKEKRGQAVVDAGLLSFRIRDNRVEIWCPPVDHPEGEVQSFPERHLPDVLAGFTALRRFSASGRSASKRRRR